MRKYYGISESEPISSPPPQDISPTKNQHFSPERENHFSAQPRSPPPKRFS